MTTSIKLRFWCNEHKFVGAGFGEPITEVHFNQRGELGLACPLCFKSRPMKIVRWTGLRDKDGTHIYEGDILLYVTPPRHADGNPDTDVYVVEWKGFGFEAIWQHQHKPNYLSDGRLSLIGCDEDMKVIGNIYRHPELLEARS